MIDSLFTMAVPKKKIFKKYKKFRSFEKNKIKNVSNFYFEKNKINFF